MDIQSVIIALAIGYGLGSIPFGLLIARMFGQGDIREIGSGNIGATNVLRTGRKDLALLTVIFDAGKAGGAALIVQSLMGFPYNLIAGAAALLGHCFPVWLKFNGGKGVATFFGCLLAVAWKIGLIALSIWLLVALVFRISSLAALMSAALVPVAAWVMGYQEVAIMAAILAVIIFVRHAENIRRILSGTESRIGSKG